MSDPQSPTPATPPPGEGPARQNRLTSVSNSSGQPTPHVPGEEIQVEQLDQNVNQVVVRVTLDKLQGHVESFQRGIETRHLLQRRVSEALGLLGIGLALVVPLFTSTFMSIGPISADTLKGACGVLRLVFLVLSLVRFVQAVHSRLVKISDHTGVSQTVDAIRFNRDFPRSS